MRLKLKKLKQKELIANYKSRTKLSWRLLARRFDVDDSTLRGWYYEKNLLPLHIYQKLDGITNFKSDILEILPENWGQSKGGLASKGHTKSIKIPTNPLSSLELAELIGIILGDGNIHRFQKGKKIRTYMVRVTGDAVKDKDYLSRYVYSLFKSLFAIEPKFYYQTYSNGLHLIVHSLRLVDFFGRIGLTYGDKLVSQVTIPKWIRKNKSLLRACLRGLIDTDGSIHRMSRKDPKLLRISFKNHNLTLLNDTRKAFIDLGFSPSKIIRSEVFVISKQGNIAKYLKEIGFSNSKHKERLKSFVAP